MTLNELRDLALKIAQEHGFTDASVGEDIALMHSELSEALEDYRNGHVNIAYLFKETATIRDKQLYDESDKPLGKPIGLPSEMADVIIRVLHFCGKHNIDIEAIVLQKMEYNQTRPFMHGGKKI